ncbi:MAG: hypothetical protein KDA77_00020 [Planctomycetaceae bacterium]|nr:hypothetical protein [Planctomycetaceae bacterium]
MIGQFEDFRLYQTVAFEDGSYPEEPTWEPEDGELKIDTQIQAASTVWYVKELLNPTFDESLDTPIINATSGTKRHYMFALGNGPCLGLFAESSGLTVAYLPEGTYLAGFWYNGQLYGIPLSFGDGYNYGS